MAETIMELAGALAIPEGKGVTALVGGGGKTSTMYRLGAEYARAGYAPIVTTTTRIGAPLPHQARLIEQGTPEAEGPLAFPGEVICVGQRCENWKLRQPEEGLWARCLEEADRVFTEADGAKRLPVKAPAGHEPVLSFPEVDSVIAVAGLTAVGKPLGEVCFRCELVCKVLDAAPEDLLTPERLARLLTSPEGQYKNVPSPELFRVFLNQADDGSLTALGMETAAHIREYLPGCRVVVGALQPRLLIRAILR